MKKINALVRAIYWELLNFLFFRINTLISASTIAWASGSNRSNNCAAYASSIRPAFNIAVCNMELEPFMSEVGVVFSIAAILCNKSAVS